MLAAEDIQVALVARRQHGLERVAEAIRQFGGTALIAPADLRDQQALRAVLKQTRTTHRLLVDTLGLPIACYVTHADLSDSQGARSLLGGLGILCHASR